MSGRRPWWTELLSDDKCYSMKYLDLWKTDMYVNWQNICRIRKNNIENVVNSKYYIQFINYLYSSVFLFIALWNLLPGILKVTYRIFHQSAALLYAWPRKTCIDWLNNFINTVPQLTFPVQCCQGRLIYKIISSLFIDL